jgi:hypothetical protein
MKNDIASLYHRFHQLRIANVTFNKLKPTLTLQTFDVLHTAGAEIVNDNYLIAVADKPLTQMRSDKTRPARDKCSHTTLGKPAQPSSNRKS